MTTDTKHNILIAAALSLLSMSVFSQTLLNDFVWDSKAVIVKEHRTKSLTESIRFFSEPYTVPETNEASGVTGGLRSVKYYRPLVGTFHALEYKLFGTRPVPYKAVNLFLNALVSVLAYFIVLNLTRNRLISVLSSVLFACNPTKTEVVYWVYSDSHMLVAVFLLSSFLFYIKQRPFLAYSSFLAALFSQENAVLLPFILLAYDLLVKQQTFKKSLLSLTPYVALAAIYLAIRHSVVGGIPTGSFSTLETLAAITVLVQRYIRIYIFTGSPVTAYRITPEISSFSNPETVISLLVFISLLTCAGILWRKKHASTFWCAWFVIWLSVSLNVGSLSDYFMAEKALYLSGLGLCVLASYALLSVSKNKTVAVSLLAMLAAIHAKQSYSRAPYWKDTVTYLENALIYDPDFAFYSYALGITYCEENRHHDALKMFSDLQRTRGESTYYTRGMTESYFALGNHLYRTNGEVDAAIEAYKQSLSYDPNQARIYNNIGNIHLTNKEHLTAIGYYEQAIALAPEHFRVFYNLALAYQGIGDHANASKYFQKFNQLSERVSR
jgi:tetratricopeptide (TPR) repeat protein